MMNDVELDLDRQTLRPGETLSGVLKGPPQQMTLTLQGEEVLSATSIAFNYILPLVDDSRQITADPGGTPFSFIMPSHAPPSYASQDLRCQYFLKLRRKQGFWGREKISRFHLTVLPPEPPSEEQPDFISLSEGPVKLDVQLDRTALITGQSLSGELIMHREDELAALPRKLEFRFAAIEESVEPGYYHRKVVWLATHDVQPTADMTYPLRGIFDFPVPEDAPFCGEWATFRVHYGFRVAMQLADGNNVRHSMPIQVSRVYHRLPLLT